MHGDVPELDVSPGADHDDASTVFSSRAIADSSGSSEPSTRITLSSA